MCGRTSSARPPAIWVRQTGARRYIARQRARPTSNSTNNANHVNTSSTNNTSNKLSKLRSSPIKSKESSTSQHVVSLDTYQPSYNAGPHFYLPVLRYLNMNRHVTTKRKHQQIDSNTLSVESPLKNTLSVQSPAKRVRLTNNVIGFNPSPKQREIADIESFIASHSDAFETSDIDAKFSPRKQISLLPTTPASSGSPSRRDLSQSPITPQSIEPELVVEAMRWGLIPSWTKGNNMKEADAAQPYTMINARAESLPDTKAYRHLLANNRCVVLVDLYFEWAVLNDKKKTKQPYVFQSTKLPRPISSFDDDVQPVDSPRCTPDIYALNELHDGTSSNHLSPINETNAKVEIKSEIKPEIKSEAVQDHSAVRSQTDTIDETLMQKPFLLLAGLFDTWRDPSTGEDIHTMTILTQSASQNLAWAHERQPVILSDENAHRWLRCDLYSYEDCRPFTLRPSSENIEFYPCAPTVGNVRNQSPECIMRLDEFEKAKKSNGIARFFQPLKAES